MYGIATFGTWSLNGGIEVVKRAGSTVCMGWVCGKGWRAKPGEEGGGAIGRVRAEVCRLGTLVLQQVITRGVVLMDVRVNEWH
jgi:hypothetical protein